MLLIRENITSPHAAAIGTSQTKIAINTPKNGLDACGVAIQPFNSLLTAPASAAVM
jgi:hypothetical protein